MKPTVRILLVVLGLGLWAAPAKAQVGEAWESYVNGQGFGNTVKTNGELQWLWHFYVRENVKNTKRFPNLGLDWANLFFHTWTDKPVEVSDVKDLDMTMAIHFATEQNVSFAGTLPWNDPVFETVTRLPEEVWLVICNADETMFNWGGYRRMAEILANSPQRIAATVVMLAQVKHRLGLKVPEDMLHFVIPFTEELLARTELNGEAAATALLAAYKLKEMDLLEGRFLNEVEGRYNASLASGDPFVEGAAQKIQKGDNLLVDFQKMSMSEAGFVLAQTKSLLTGKGYLQDGKTPKTVTERYKYFVRGVTGPKKGKR
jgi:hypothetical protein